MLGPSEGALGGQDAPDGFPASGRNAYPSGAKAFFADVLPQQHNLAHFLQCLVRVSPTEISVLDPRDRVPTTRH